MPDAYYNEIEPYPAEWLRNLTSAGHIAPGYVDNRSIHDVKAQDLTGYKQAHFFAGIGVWSYALRLAGWPDDLPVWTGSCPCQPFSAAGKRGGTDDPRHLWPEWFRLIRECRPPVIFGEQVASKDGLAWLDGVYADLEGEGYAVAAFDLPAAGVGAPHKRQRIYFVANTNGTGLSQRFFTGRVQQETEKVSRKTWFEFERVLSGGDWNQWSTESGISLFDNGSPARVGRLRAYGNAIVAPLADEFIRAYMETLKGYSNA